MLRLGTKIFVAATLTSAIGLSCTACLSTPATYDTIAVRSGQTDIVLPKADSDEPIRLASSKMAHQPIRQLPPAPQPKQHQPLQFSSSSYIQPSSNQIDTGASFRPVGEVSGIDITVAEFAQSTSSPLKYQGSWQKEDVQKIDAGYTFIANKQDTGLGLDLAVRPHVSINAQGDVRTTRAGAEVRVGQNLDLRGQKARNSNWYFFAGADGEAVVWDVQRRGSSLTDGQVTLQDKVTIGDVQAGIAFQSPAGQMSISYIQREFEYRNGAISRSGEEEFAAVTLTWRR